MAIRVKITQKQACKFSAPLWFYLISLLSSKHSAQNCLCSIILNTTKINWNKLRPIFDSLFSFFLDSLILFLFYTMILYFASQGKSKKIKTLVKILFLFSITVSNIGVLQVKIFIIKLFTGITYPKRYRYLSLWFALLK